MSTFKQCTWADMYSEYCKSLYVYIIRMFLCACVSKNLRMYFEIIIRIIAYSTRSLYV